MTDWRALAATTVLSAVVFVAVLFDNAAAQVGGPSAWGYTPIIGLAALLGAGDRKLRGLAKENEPGRPPA